MTRAKKREMEWFMPLASIRTWDAAAVQAPMDIKPSRAMLTTPLFSQIIPPMAVMRIGATIMRTEGSIPIIILI